MDSTINSSLENLDAEQDEDIHFYEDFFFNDFRTNREPDNLVSLIHTNDAYVATLMGKFKMNNFYRTTTRLPELSLDFTRRPVGHSGIFHQGTITAGVYGEVVGNQEQAELLRLQALGAGGLAGVLADPLGTAAAAYIALAGLQRNASLTGANVTQGLSTIATRLREPGFGRFHTYHEFLYPKTYMGWLNVTPRIGAGMTSYGGIVGSPTGLSASKQRVGSAEHTKHRRVGRRKSRHGHGGHRLAKRFDFLRQRRDSDVGVVDSLTHDADVPAHGVGL